MTEGTRTDAPAGTPAAPDRAAPDVTVAGTKGSFAPVSRSATSSPADGIYRARGQFSITLIGVYVFLALIIALVVWPDVSSAYRWVPYFLLGLIVFLLVRYLSTNYTLDDTKLRARRLLGGRTIELDEVRSIEYASLRSLTPTTGWFGVGPLGWHGRMWSPQVGEFDTVYTEPARGLLVTAGTHPLYLSPKAPEAFARELSRRVRSYTGPLAKDVGAPGAAYQ
jgi:PH (Pleckstrin Homology) domain-containing protein